MLPVLYLKLYRYVIDLYFTFDQKALVLSFYSLRQLRKFHFFYKRSNKQGVGGIVELAPGYLPAVHRIVKKTGGLFIADEVQSGFARTGSHFWGFETQGVVPDIVTMAKVN